MKKILAIMFVLCILCLSSCGLFKDLDTTDIEKYGIYDTCAHENIGEFFPELDKSIMSNFKYSYNAYCFIDCAHEIYLEFTIENDDEFTQFINEKQSRIMQENTEATVQKLKYDESYTEVVIEDRITTRYSNDGELVIDSAYIRKLIYNEDINSIIFVHLYVVDYWEFENSTYIERFNIDPNTLNKR